MISASSGSACFHRPIFHRLASFQRGSSRIHASAVSWASNDGESDFMDSYEFDSFSSTNEIRQMNPFLEPKHPLQIMFEQEFGMEVWALFFPPSERGDRSTHSFGVFGGDHHLKWLNFDEQLPFNEDEDEPNCWLTLEDLDQDYTPQEEIDREKHYEGLTATRAGQLAAVKEKALEFQHSQMERSCNRFYTVLLFGEMLKAMNEMDDCGVITIIPAWMRAMFVMERQFDRWNALLHRDLMDHAERMGRTYHYDKVQSYKAELGLEVGADYDQLLFKLRQKSEAQVELNSLREREQEEEELLGVGDQLDPLLDVLPGVGRGPRPQAAQFAADLMLPRTAAAVKAGSGAAEMDGALDEEERDRDLDF